MRANFWDYEGNDDARKWLGILVRVQYWWKEGRARQRLQVLHDIMLQLRLDEVAYIA